MSINQLFREKPDKEFVIKILNIYNIDGFDTSKTFTLKDIENNDTINKLNDISIMNKLEGFYLKCKWKYIKDLNSKKSLTLLRQLLKIYNYKISSKEKCINGFKFCI